MAAWPRNAHAGPMTASISWRSSELYATKRWMTTMWLSSRLAFIAVFVEISLRT
jgi:hypothetical protein